MTCNKVLKKYEAHITLIKKDAEFVVKNVMPEKVIELTLLLTSDLFVFDKQSKNLEQVINIPVPSLGKEHVEDVTNKLRKCVVSYGKDWDNNEIVIESESFSQLPTGQVQCNEVVTELTDTVEPHVRLFQQHANLLRRWLKLLIPRREDGDNSGVALQHEILSLVISLEQTADGFCRINCSHHSDRASLFADIIKYPYLDDYRKALHKMDIVHYTFLVDCIREMRNNYEGLYDVLEKNWEKINKPRLCNVASMY